MYHSSCTKTVDDNVILFTPFITTQHSHDGSECLHNTHISIDQELAGRCVIKWFPDRKLTEQSNAVMNMGRIFLPRSDRLTRYSILPPRQGRSDDLPRKR